MFKLLFDVHSGPDDVCLKYNQIELRSLNFVNHRIVQMEYTIYIHLRYYKANIGCKWMSERINRMQEGWTMDVNTEKWTQMEEYDNYFNWSRYVSRQMHLNDDEFSSNV